LLVAFVSSKRLHIGERLVHLFVLSNLKDLRRVLVLRVALALLAVCAWSRAHAADARIVYYDITGNSASVLRDQLDIKGPIGKTGKHVDAFTKWHVAWKHHYRPTSTGCRFTDMQVSVTGTILMPRWVYPSDVSRSLLRRWQDYLAALLLHEQGHYAHGASAAEAITALEDSFHDYSGNCQTMVQSFKDQAHAILARYQAMDAAYDKATDHGRTQGARFP
jgi:predicted secreted Zn-dependent protease